jgi:hypothetical protein
VPQLVVNLPAISVWVRKEYLTDFQSGHGEFVRGVWVSAKSIPGRAFYFETYLPEYGAMYDKLPISAFVSSPATPSPDMKLHDLQFWNCMDYGIAVIKKSFVSTMDFELYTRSKTKVKGSYLFTLDNYHSDLDTIDTNTSEKPDEHKSHNVIRLENGQFAIYPNNRMRIYDLSLTPEKPIMPDFKVSTKVYQVESGLEWKRLGDTDDYFWKNSEENFEE